MYFPWFLEVKLLEKPSRNNPIFMSKIDIYADELMDREHSLRYIHIVAKDVIGILNRIASLMRRKRYNMEEVSVSFDDQGRAHFVVAIDGRLHDVQHVIQQLLKLYDVYEAYDATHHYDRLYNAVYVQVSSEEDFKLFPVQPAKVVTLENLHDPQSVQDLGNTPGGLYGIFIVSMQETPALMQFLHEENYPYRRRVMGLI